jgi:hypothetical protein
MVFLILRPQVQLLPGALIYQAKISSEAIHSGKLGKANLDLKKQKINKKIQFSQKKPIFVLVQYRPNNGIFSKDA